LLVVLRRKYSYFEVKHLGSLQMQMAVASLPLSMWKSFFTSR
jgi:hypothetical protein